MRMGLKEENWMGGVTVKYPFALGARTLQVLVAYCNGVVSENELILLVMYNQ